MAQPSVTVASPKVRLNPDAWFKECVRFGLLTDEQRAAAIGTTRTAINQIQNGHRAPSNAFIALVMGYMAPRLVRFEDIFTWEAP